MKVALSIPEDLFAAAESLGRKLRVSRSRLYATALAEFVAKHQTRKVTEQLDRVHGAGADTVEQPLRRAQARAVGVEPW